MQINGLPNFKQLLTLTFGMCFKPMHQKEHQLANQIILKQLLLARVQLQENINFFLLQTLENPPQLVLSSPSQLLLNIPDDLLQHWLGSVGLEEGCVTRVKHCH